MSEHSHNDHFIALGPSRLKMALGIVVVVLVVELIGGLLSNSLALLSDAGHMLVDAMAIGLALFAIQVAEGPPLPPGPTATTAWRFWPLLSTASRWYCSRCTSSMRPTSVSRTLPTSIRR